MLLGLPQHSPDLPYVWRAVLQLLQEQLPERLRLRVRRGVPERAVHLRLWPQGKPTMCMIQACLS